jgi:hypothetical protein
MPQSDVDDSLDKRVRAILEAVDACRRAMIDLTLADKDIALERLRGWVEVERGTHEPIQ